MCFSYGALRTNAQKNTHTFFPRDVQRPGGFWFLSKWLELFGFPRAWEEFSQIPSLRPFLRLASGTRSEKRHKQSLRLYNSQPA